MARLKRKKPGSKKPRVKEKADAQGEAESGNQQAVAALTVKELKRKPAAGSRVISSSAPSRVRAPGKEPGWIQKSIQFLREVSIELKKVTWPTRKQTIGSTVVVMVLVMLIALYLGLVDMGLTSLVRAILG